MSVFNVNLELEVVKYLDIAGDVVVEVYDKNRGDSEPLFTETFSLFELAKDFVDLCSDDTGLITDCDAADIAYTIVDELQDTIDYLNNAIEDPEETV